MLEVWSGHEPHQFITTALHFLDTHMPRKYLLPALEYLKRNQLVGEKLATLIYQELSGDYLQFQLWLIRKVESDKTLRLLAGKTFK